MTFEDLSLLNLEGRGAYVVSKLKKHARAREECVLIATDFLMAAQGLADLPKPQSYFDVIELLKTVLKYADE